MIRPGMNTLAPVREQIEKKLQQCLKPSFLQVIDESERHEGHPGKPLRQETHFRVLVISSSFEGLSLRDRHRKVYQLLKQELEDVVHALQLETKTPSEAAELQSPK
jgi:stress-induced morphogen